MEITAGLIYLVSLCDKVVDFSIGLILVGGICSIFGTMFCSFENNWKVAYYKFIPIAGYCVLLTGMIFATFVPSSKTAAAMIVIPAVAKNERVQGIASQSLDAVDGLLKLSNKWLEQQVGEKEEKSKTEK